MLSPFRFEYMSMKKEGGGPGDKQYIHSYNDVALQNLNPGQSKIIRLA
jgi:hypothetical protein